LYAKVVLEEGVNLGNRGAAPPGFRVL